MLGNIWPETTGFQRFLDWGSNSGIGIPNTLGELTFGELTFAKGRMRRTRIERKDEEDMDARKTIQEESCLTDEVLMQWEW